MAANESDLTVRSDLTGKIDAVHTELTGRIDTVRTDLTGKIDTLRSDLNAKIDALRAELVSAKIWALGLYGSMLYVLARGFKWL